MVTPRRGVMVVALQVVAVPPWRRRLRRLASPGLGGIAICFAAAQVCKKKDSNVVLEFRSVGVLGLWPLLS